MDDRNASLFERPLVALVPTLSRHVRKPRQGRLAHVLSGTHPEPRALRLQRLPEVWTEPHGRLVHSPISHIPIP
jgi:hypothetical protein